MKRRKRRNNIHWEGESWPLYMVWMNRENRHYCIPGPHPLLFSFIPQDTHPYIWDKADQVHKLNKLTSTIHNMIKNCGKDMEHAWPTQLFSNMFSFCYSQWISQGTDRALFQFHLTSPTSHAHPYTHKSSRHFAASVGLLCCQKGDHINQSKFTDSNKYLNHKTQQSSIFITNEPHMRKYNIKFLLHPHILVLRSDQTQPWAPTDNRFEKNKFYYLPSSKIIPLKLPTNSQLLSQWV